LLEVAMENRERREPVHHAPRAAVAGGPQLESMVAMALPSVSFHKSGLYLERTGTAVMAE
jgi:hypothetical protein